MGLENNRVVTSIGVNAKVLVHSGLVSKPIYKLNSSSNKLESNTQCLAYTKDS